MRTKWMGCSWHSYAGFGLDKHTFHGMWFAVQDVQLRLAFVTLHWQRRG